MNKTGGSMPDISQLEKELTRVSHRSGFGEAVLHVILLLVGLAAVIAILAVTLLPVCRVTDDAMSPALSRGEIVVGVRGLDIVPGDLVLVPYGNRTLVRRVVAMSGQTVQIGTDGTVYLDDVPYKEPYVAEMAQGEITEEMPLTVPYGRYFVMCDKRSVSSDSRSDMIGCVAEEQLKGKVVMRLWPVSRFGKLIGVYPGMEE